MADSLPPALAQEAARTKQFFVPDPRQEAMRIYVPKGNFKDGQPTLQPLLQAAGRQHYNTNFISRACLFWGSLDRCDRSVSLVVKCSAVLAPRAAGRHAAERVSPTFLLPPPPFLADIQGHQAPPDGDVAAHLEDRLRPGAHADEPGRAGRLGRLPAQQVNARQRVRVALRHPACSKTSRPHDTSNLNLPPAACRAPLRTGRRCGLTAGGSRRLTRTMAGRPSAAPRTSERSATCACASSLTPISISECRASFLSYVYCCLMRTDTLSCISLLLRAQHNARAQGPPEWTCVPACSHTSPLHEPTALWLSA